MNKRHQFGFTVAVSVFVLVVGVPRGRGQEADELKQRFLQEAPSRWEEYVRRSGELQGIVSVSNTGTLNAHEYRARMEYKTNGQGKVLKVVTKHTVKGKVDQDDEEVFGVNPQYAFTLLRKSANSPWVLTDLSVGSKGKALDRVIFRLNDYLGSVTYGTILDGEPLIDVVHQPGFRIENCRTFQKEGEELVELAFTYSKEESNQKKRSLSGRLFFDPNRYWCLRSGNIQVTGDIVGGTQKIKVTQSDKSVDLPPLSRIYETDGDWVSSSGSKNRQMRRYDVILTQPTHLPADEEFTLSAFGLPEPRTIHQRTRRHLWVALAGILCLGVAALFRWKVRRAKTASKSPQSEGP